MKALLPVYCRPLGYVILVFCSFYPFYSRDDGKSN